MHYLADLQLVHGVRCYDNIHVRMLTLQMHIAVNVKCQQMLVVAPCLAAVSMAI